MRSVELAKVAAAAEALRLKCFAKRQGVRVGFAIGAVLFLVAVLAMLHMLAVVLLWLVMRLWIAVLIVLAVDAVAAGILGSLALRDTPDRVELEAAQIRRQALTEAKASATSLATVGEAAGVAIGLMGRRKARGTRLGRAWLIADLASRFIRR